MSRTEFTLLDTGYDVQTSAPVFGELHQLRWKLASGDTGGSIVVSVQPVAPGGDTGYGYTVLSMGLQPNLVIFPRMATHDISGAPDNTDTGTPASPVPAMLCGDHVRVEFSPGATARGSLYIWIKD